jgi:excisionase family DNA binding protein
MRLKSSQKFIPNDVLTINEPEPLLVDIPGAARMLSSTKATIRNILWRREIPFVKIGRRFLIDPADLRAYIARMKTAA